MRLLIQSANDRKDALLARSLPMLTAAIFDVDGVLLASPHERAWREALVGFADPDRFTTAMYQSQVAGKLRLDGARSALEALGVSDAERRADLYAERKQARLEVLIRTGAVAAFPDALRFVETVAGLGWPMAAASSSKNATEMMRSIRMSTGRSLLDLFRVNVSGRPLKHGKPDPELFLIASAELGVPPIECLVAEDAPAGIRAANAYTPAIPPPSRTHRSVDPGPHARRNVTKALKCVGLGTFQQAFANSPSSQLDLRFGVSIEEFVPAMPMQPDTVD